MIRRRAWLLLAIDVAVAISLQPALREWLDERQISARWGASTLLARQLERGAPGDLFVSAAPEEIDGLQQVVDRCTVAGNRLVVVVEAGATPPSSLAALNDLERVAVGNPRTSPLGRYTRQAFDTEGLRWDRRLITAEHARQTIDYLLRGEVDAAVIYRSDAQRFAERLAVGPAFPSTSHEPIRYEAALLHERARALFTELCAAQQPFIDAGFERWSDTP